MNFPLLNTLVDLFSQKGIAHAVLCPGSRSAPLTLSFLRNKNFVCRTFSDERSAAFIALGIAQQKRLPIVLVCTSGSAAYNFAPAVSEAFLQHIPLIVLTADRPKEWIDQMDGQTIRQTNLYNNHVKKYFELTLDDPHPDASWHAQRIINEAVNLSQSGIPGPVHINIPLREPLYPAAPEKQTTLHTKVIEQLGADSMLSDDSLKQLIREIHSFKSILVVSGQNEYDAELCKSLGEFHALHPWPIAGDILSNLHSLPFFCRYTDTYLGQAPLPVKESLQPDLLITFGKSLVSKNLKLYLRSFQPRAHWHLQTSGEAADTFQCLTKTIPIRPTVFFNQLKGQIINPPLSPTYEKNWRDQETITHKAVSSFFTPSLPGEFSLVNQILRGLPERCNLHLANSMSVRYANHAGLTSSQKNVIVFSNRGTSGIDGCTSTAMGHALESAVTNILITGDQAFFYDRNAFWHNYTIPNLFVVILNNHGGLIFNLIDGPSRLPEANEYFITRQNLNARALAAEFGLDYLRADQAVIEDFFKVRGKVRILEIETSQADSKIQFETFKSQIRKNYGI